jgi:hypothetical protein
VCNLEALDLGLGLGLGFGGIENRSVWNVFGPSVAASKLSHFCCERPSLLSVPAAMGAFFLLFSLFGKLLFNQLLAEVLCFLVGLTELPLKSFCCVSSLSWHFFVCFCAWKAVGGWSSD